MNLKWETMVCHTHGPKKLPNPILPLNFAKVSNLNKPSLKMFLRGIRFWEPFYEASLKVIDVKEGQIIEDNK